MKKKKRTAHFMTIKAGKAETLPKPIDHKVWDKITDDISELLWKANLPEGIKLFCKGGKGSPIIDSNHICFGPKNKDQGTDFVVKRTGTSIIVKVYSRSKLYDTIVSACFLTFKSYLGDNVTLSTSEGYESWENGISYFEYILDRPAPLIFPNQSRKAIITFEWLPNLPPEDYEQTLEDIRSIIKGNGINVSIRLDS